mmetsp:Transcript_55925/g.133735  ORF Transcript_55925/g.133735 Transcript_55925/m.133735 type:complete len:231 (-) Transcript_55925:293-985(-)
MASTMIRPSGTEPGRSLRCELIHNGAVRGLKTTSSASRTLSLWLQAPFRGAMPSFSSLFRVSRISLHRGDAGDSTISCSTSTVTGAWSIARTCHAGKALKVVLALMLRITAPAFTPFCSARPPGVTTWMITGLPCPPVRLARSICGESPWTYRRKIRRLFGFPLPDCGAGIPGRGATVAPLGAPADHSGTSGTFARPDMELLDAEAEGAACAACAQVGTETSASCDTMAA